jgi:hypothetical protein
VTVTEVENLLKMKMDAVVAVEETAMENML